MDFRKLFAVTISPVYRTLRPDYLYNQDKYVIQRLFNKCSQHYMMMPEFSVAGRLHWHGVVYVNDFIKWYRHVIHAMRHEWMIIKIDPIRSHLDHLRWLCYCYKDKHKHCYTPVMYSKLKKSDVGKDVGLDVGIPPIFTRARLLSDLELINRYIAI